jgi:hypothetical protein
LHGSRTTFGLRDI